MDDSKSKLEELNKEIDNLKKKHLDFLEAAAHDLHAPLRRISAFADRIIEKNTIETGTVPYINRIKSSIVEMQRLIDNLTDLAIVNSKIVQYSDCDLNEILKKILSELHDEIAQKRAVINVTSLPIIKGDPNQYKQLFMNIIENALKFTKKNSQPEVDITTSLLTPEDSKRYNLEMNDNYFKIIIADNGIGFARQYAEKIFEPFVRLHAKSDYPGTGLGLSISKKIVANHNGIIYAIGNEDKGAQFIIVLPAKP